MNLDRMRRLLLLVPLARQYGSQGIPIDEALRALHLDSVDALTEHVDELAMVGDPSGSPDAYVDIYIEGDRVRVVLPLGFAHPPRFTPVEAAAMLSALRPFDAAELPEVESLRTKLCNALPVTKDEKLEAALLARTAQIEAAQPPSFRNLLEDAAERRSEVEFTYFALGDGVKKTRRVEPRAVMLHSGRWYLVAWNVEKEEQHLYRLDRMSDVTLTGRTFDAHKGPSLDRYALDHLYVPSGAEQDVVVRFAPRIADVVMRDWPDESERHDDGTVTVRVRRGGRNFLIAWVLGYGGDAEIVGPASLRAELAERVARLRDVYATDPA